MCAKHPIQGKMPKTFHCIFLYFFIAKVFKLFRMRHLGGHAIKHAKYVQLNMLVYFFELT